MDDWQKKLSAVGCRITRPRREIMAVLERSAVPLAPPEILSRAQRACPHMSLVTVYRALALYCEHDLARRVYYSDGGYGYALASPGHHHALVCRHCGQAVEFAGCAEMDALIARLEARTGFAIDEHLLQLYGLCAACRANTGDATHSPTD